MQLFSMLWNTLEHSAILDLKIYLTPILKPYKHSPKDTMTLSSKSIDERILWNILEACCLTPNVVKVSRRLGLLVLVICFLNHSMR